MGLNILKPLATLLGYEMVRREKSERMPALCSRLFASLPAQILLDVGANLGQFARAARASGFAGDIHSFEPASAPFAELEKASRRDARWFAHNLGVGDEPGALELNTDATRHDFNSFLPPDRLMAERFTTVELSGRESIEVVRLDAFLESRDIPSDAPIVVKTDTQGFDLRVMTGLGQRIGQVVALVTEMAVQPIYEGASSHWEVLDLVRRHGFEPYGFAPVSRDRRGRLIEYDGVFVRPEAFG
jgi:FkbM family methyltransferase